jgi:antitoxin StbD
MDILLSDRSIGISELREAPARIFQSVGARAVTVLNHNKPAGYLVSKQWMQNVMDRMADQVITQKARLALAELPKARKIAITAL